MIFNILLLFLVAGTEKYAIT